MSSRRKFLQHSLATLSGVALTYQAFPSILIPQAKSKLGVALVGLGYYSTDLLAPALQLTEHCYLAGIVTGTPSKAEEWKKRHVDVDKMLGPDYQGDARPSAPACAPRCDAGRAPTAVGDGVRRTENAVLRKRRAEVSRPARGPRCRG